MGIEARNTYTKWVRLSVLIAAVWMVPPASAADCRATDPSLAGAYELQGVMETGSIIVLLPDGRFGYSLIVGAYEEIAEGCWRKVEGTVELVPTVYKANDGDNRFDKLRLKLSRRNGLIRSHRGQKYGEYVLVKKFPASGN